jgi:hypothetical protein
MHDCTCICECKPNSISFWWMNDCHTFVRLKGKNIEEILIHVCKCFNDDKYGMLCPATLLKDGKELYRIGQPIHGGANFHKEILKWVNSIKNDPYAMDIIKSGKIE